MAGRRKKAAKPDKGKKGKEAKPHKAKAPKEPKEIKPGPPVESVMLIVTGLMLIGAIVVLDFVKGRDYGTGMMFAGKYEETE